MTTSPLANPLYDDPALARAYRDVTATNVYNATYERPAIRRIVGDVAGRDLLDAGCAAGENALWWAERGARVTAVDASDAMVALARERLGERAMHLDLARPLPFADGAFDLVASSLTLHYLATWAPTLAEFRRVLRLGGRLVVSTHHPLLTLDPAAPYRETRLVQETWASFNEDGVPVQFYHRPLETIVNEIVEAGFVLQRLHEPGATAAIAERDAHAAERLDRGPVFLIIEAVRP